MMPLKFKLKRRKYLDKNTAILYGFKFHFKGRFKRKQKAANLWFLRGSMSNSTMSQNIDRAFKTFNTKYSACTIRIWLYKNENAPKYLLRLI